MKEEEREGRENIKDDALSSSPNTPHWAPVIRTVRQYSGALPRTHVGTKVTSAGSTEKQGHQW